MSESKRGYFEDHLGPNAPPIHTVLEEEERRRLGIAACALLLELAHADDHFSDAERIHIEDVIRRHFALDADGARMLISVAQSARDSASGIHEFADLMREKLDDGQKGRLLELMWRLALSDGEIAQRETYLMERVGGLLGVASSVLAAARTRASGGTA
ncbi:MAG TPA: TerB family tellurite resistance protein [Longimicrobiales bacterium]